MNKILNTTNTKGDKIQIIFNESYHTYKIGKEKIPSVTSILGLKSKPFLIPWAVKLCADYYRDNIDKELVYEESKKQHRNILSVAGEIGSRVHGLIDRDEKSNENDSFQVKNCMEAFQKFKGENKFEVITKEEMIYNETDDGAYVGMYDCICNLDGIKTLVDYKTGGAIYDEVWSQLGAYLSAIGDINIKQVACLRLDKNSGEYELKTMPSLDSQQHYFKIFCPLLRLYYGNLEITKMSKDNKKGIV